MPILIQRLAVTATYDIEPDWWSIKPGIGFVVLDLSLNAKEGSIVLIHQAWEHQLLQFPNTPFFKIPNRRNRETVRVLSDVDMLYTRAVR